MQNEALDILKDYNNLENFGYLILFFYSMGGGYIAILTAAALSSVGTLDLTFSIIVAICGNALGSSLFALFARTQQAEVRRMFGKHRRKIACMYLMTKKYDWGLFIVSKYLHGIRSFVPLAVGISQYNLTKFVFINCIGAVIWGISLGIAGYYASGFLFDIIKMLLAYPYALPAVFVGIFIFIASLLFIKKKIQSSRILQE
ncbi:integral membrane protein [Helicobacter bilis]|uniref:Integral membrane protein n=1 Tax=Helicobacter bilis TaxID=37372 RepID=A0A1Q2LHF9_9HELI|nr:DedA family protein [Helicobacter bilis]AQQ59848.1 integral membrane protein [Helicobacter bilis]